MCEAPIEQNATKLKHLISLKIISATTGDKALSQFFDFLQNDVKSNLNKFTELKRKLSLGPLFLQEDEHVQLQGVVTDHENNLHIESWSGICRVRV